MGLGPAALVTLAEARDKAHQARQELFAGIDPLEAKKAQRAAARRAQLTTMTFKEATKLFLAARSAQWRSERWFQEWANTLDRYADPVLGDLSVAEIETPHVLKVLEPVWCTKPKTATAVRQRALMPSEVVEACISRGVRERPRISTVHYAAFADPSGGSADSFSIAVSHREGEVAVLDAVRERKPPFSPDAVVLEFSELLKSYGVTTVHGDRYAGEWPRERFQVHGITYRPAERTKSELYGALLPLLNSQRADLLDVPRLEAQLVGLERRISRGGKDSIDHAPGGHDDVANAAAGALVMVGAQALSVIDCLGPEPEGYRSRMLSQYPLLRGLS